MSNGNVNTNGIPVIETQTLEWSSAGLGNAVSPLTSSQISVSVIWNSAVTDSANTREAHQKLHSSSSIHIDNNDSDIDNIIHPVQIPNGHGPPHSIGKKIQKRSIHNVDVIVNGNFININIINRSSMSSAR